ncbi:hypothetical protein MtrunA17_Chr7g0238001 [Medicago truncatula]|uniref:LCR n=1 Tax=Medicago truncatula TaxID=3880 RepID=A0A072TZE5_MEDTR|nr:LCR [Medicago truncatula]RHN46045.1 hypothetical protein MtrunA17_Chr7g0238001 [Medicago truncatula]
MAKHIFQYFLLGVLCIVFLLSSGSTQDVNYCSKPCPNTWECDAKCRSQGQGGSCMGNFCCCQ